MGTFCSKKTQGKIIRNLNSSLYIISRDQFSALKKDGYNSKKEFKQAKKSLIVSIQLLIIIQGFYNFNDLIFLGNKITSCGAVTTKFNLPKSINVDCKNDKCNLTVNLSKIVTLKNF